MLSCEDLSEASSKLETNICVAAYVDPCVLVCSNALSLMQWYGGNELIVGTYASVCEGPFLCYMVA